MSGTSGAPLAGDAKGNERNLGTFADAVLLDSVDEVRLLTGAAATSSKQPA